MYYSIIVAKSRNSSIGDSSKNCLLWDIKSEMNYFRKTTAGCTVIMGRKTWESIGKKPLPRRNNIIISTSINFENVFNNFEDGLQYAFSLNEKIFVIGGESLYSKAIQDYRCKYLFISKIISPDYEGDVKFPKFNKNNFRKTMLNISYDNLHTIEYILYERKHEEEQYFELIKKIISNPTINTEKTIGVFGESMRFNLERGFPLLTTKKIFVRAVIKELLWFIRGSTNSDELSRDGVKIWDKNGSKEYLESIGILRDEGDLGPVYGFQWRHFGASYVDHKTNYSNQGYDQLQYIIEEIKNNPESRRIIMNSWNVSDLKKMALPPCHVMCQFNVSNNKLNCILYQRSCDIGLGVPFNIASYSLLTHMIASVTKLRVGEFIHMLGDAHIYKDHINELKEQITRKPFNFPTLNMVERNSIDDFTFEDFKFENYQSHPSIHMKLII